MREMDSWGEKCAKEGDVGEVEWRHEGTLLRGREKARGEREGGREG